MKMAKASEADLNMAMTLTNALESLGDRFCPAMPEAIELVGDPYDSYEQFDRDDDEQCGRALRYLLDLTGQASLMRVVFGCAVVLDPKNKCVDPDADTIEHHPDVIAAMALLQSAAAKDVLAERQRQVSAEGWTPEHDDMHKGGQLSLAAACYTLAANRLTSQGEIPSIWPWAPSFWKPAYGRRDLVKAGALILAEIERMDRAAQNGGAA